MLETFQGATEPFQPDLPLWPDPLRTPPPRPDSDLILTWFGPEKAAFSGPNQVEIRSEGPNQVWGEVFGGGIEG